MTQPGRPLVSAVRDLGVQFMDNPLNITGHDCSSSIPLPDGQSFWIFGDTMEGPFETIRNHPLDDVISGTGAIVPIQDLSQGVRTFRHLATPDGRSWIGTMAQCADHIVERVVPDRLDPGPVAGRREVAERADALRQVLDRDDRAGDHIVEQVVPDRLERTLHRVPEDPEALPVGDTMEGPFETIRNHPLDDVISGTGAIVPIQDLSQGVRMFRHLATPDGTRPRQLLQWIPPEHKSTQSSRM